MPRPPSYNKRRPDEARAHILAGKSARRVLAHALGIREKVLDLWCAEHPDFASAIADARAELTRIRAAARQGVRAGRKTLYTADMDEAARVHAATGKTDEGIAKELGVSITTLRNWRESHPSLHIAIQVGRDHWSTTAVEDSLIKRALGYEYKEVAVQKVKGKPVCTTVTKRHMPPDSRAAQFVLTNRAPERWRQRQEVEHKGEVSLAVPDAVQSVLTQCFNDLGSTAPATQEAV